MNIESQAIITESPELDEKYQKLKKYIEEERSGFFGFWGRMIYTGEFLSFRDGSSPFGNPITPELTPFGLLYSRLTTGVEMMPRYLHSLKVIARENRHMKNGQSFPNSLKKGTEELTL